MSGPLETMARMGSTNGETGAGGRVYKMGYPVSSSDRDTFHTLHERTQATHGNAQVGLSSVT